MDLWEENISKVEAKKVYQISLIQVHVWSHEKKLSTTMCSVITLIPNDKPLHEVNVCREQIDFMPHTIEVP